MKLTQNKKVDKAESGTVLGLDNNHYVVFILQVLEVGKQFSTVNSLLMLYYYYIESMQCTSSHASAPSQNDNNSPCCIHSRSVHRCMPVNRSMESDHSPVRPGQLRPAANHRQCHSPVGLHCVRFPGSLYMPGGLRSRGEPAHSVRVGW